MSEICSRGYKYMCFQCGEKDCGKYEPEPPKWVNELINELMNDETFIRAMGQIKEGSET